nr:unnamed protein product [Digitaria exilis]
MARDDGGSIYQQPSCTTVPLGKSVRRALRAAMGIPKPKKRKDVKPRKKKKPPPPAGKDDGSSTPELMWMSLSKEEAAARKESVVRVVLSSGVVEVYPGVVLACTVIRKHPPGLCLALPDVFRNPHGALLRPLEPLFPGQKFLLIPWSTVEKLKQRIPESSIGAFADDDDDAGDGEEEDTTTGSDDEPTSSTETEVSEDHSISGAVEEEEEAAAVGDGVSSSFMPACSARDYFEARDRWSACRFRRLVEQGIAVEPSTDDDDQPAEDLHRNKGDIDKAHKKGKTKKKIKGPHRKTMKRGERRPAAATTPPAGLLRGFAMLRRTWEPSLPSVEEEENVVVSPIQSPARRPPEEEGANARGQ